MADTEPVSIQDMLSAALKSLEKSGPGRKIRIIRQIDPTAPRLAVDRDLMRKVLDSLLAEAAAGTDKGGRIRVCLKHSPAALMVSIKDQGPGMDPAEWDRRVEDASRPPAPGAPLSLEKCRQAILSLGGNLFANAREGKGITYYVTFPPPPAA